MAQAIKYFTEASSREPGFAPSWAYLSTSYCISHFLNADEPRVEYPKALMAAQRALQLDPTSSEAHTAMACIHNLFQWNWVQGEAELRTAIELNPNYSLAHQWYSFTLLQVGQPEQAVGEMKLALRSDPLSLRTNLTYEGRLLDVRKYQDAISHALAVIELYPDNIVIHRLLAEAYEHTGRLDRARQEFKKFLAGNEAGRSLRTTCQSLNYSQCKQQFIKLEANTELDELKRKRQKGQYASPAEYAQTYLQLGEKRKAMHWLELAYEHGCSTMLSLNSPEFDELRSQIAFQELVAKVGLPRAVH